jgi:hypothetical protein
MRSEEAEMTRVIKRLSENELSDHSNRVKRAYDSDFDYRGRYH